MPENDIPLSKEVSESAEAQTSIATAADAEAAAADAAINEAVDYANASISAGDTGNDIRPIERAQLSREERAALSRKIARRQRDLGIRELERAYPGTIVVPASIAIGDPNIASSAQRFLGLADRTIYLLNRFGSRFMGAVEVAKVNEIMEGLIQKYVEEARDSLSQGRLLTERAKVASANNGDQWFEPQYTSKTLDISFGVKTRPALAIVRALQQWDAAIVEFAALDFNGEGDVDQIDSLRQRERRLFSDINRLCLRSIQNVSRRRQQMARPVAKADGEAVGASEVANEANEADAAAA